MFRYPCSKFLSLKVLFKSIESTIAFNYFGQNMTPLVPLLPQVEEILDSCEKQESKDYPVTVFV